MSTSGEETLLEEVAHVRDYMDGLGVARAMGRLHEVVEALAS